MTNLYPSDPASNIMLKLITIAGVLLLGIYLAFTETRTGQEFLLKRMAEIAMSSEPESFAGLRVFMCGTSSPLPARDRAQGCVAVSAGERLFIVDAGAGSAANLATEPLNRLEAVLLTHFHSDHIAALADFNLNSWVAGRPRPLRVLGPERVERVVSALNEAYAPDRGYRMAHHGTKLLPPALGTMVAETISPGVILDDNGLLITAFTADHAPVAPAVGYRFDYQGRSVVVSGDTVVSASLLTAARGADLLLQDALSLPIIRALEAAARGAGQDRRAKILSDIQEYHAPASGLLDLAAEVGTLAVYHLIPPPRNFLMEKIFARDLPGDTVITEDGMIFELPAGSRRIDVRRP